MSKSFEFSRGWIRPDIRAELNSSISIVKGVLATLSLEHPSVWIRKYRTTPHEHLRILLKEIQTEVLALESFMDLIPEMPPENHPPRKPYLTVISRV